MSTSDSADAPDHQQTQPVVVPQSASEQSVTTNATPERNASSFAAIRISWRENLSANISNMIQEFRPVFEPSSRTSYRANPNESFVINLDNSQAGGVGGGGGGDDSPNHLQNSHEQEPNMLMDTPNDPNDSTNDNNLSDVLTSIPDTATRYLPYICILIAKSC